MIEGTISAETATPKLVEVSLARFVGYFLRLGTFGFGGPIALAGHMQQDLVEDRHWISKQDYVEGLALAQLAPGPVGCATSNLSWLCPQRNPWRHRRRRRVCLAFVLDGTCVVRRVRALWRPALDAGHILWNRSSP